jgi:hypothetical protein
MPLSITLRGENAKDLGFLLFKNPNRPQVFTLSCGKAHVFCTADSEAESTAALLFDIDPIDLAKRKAGSKMADSSTM